MYTLWFLCNIRTPGSDLQEVILSHLRYQILETGDDVGALEFLVVAETAGHHHHSDEGDGQIQLQRDRHGVHQDMNGKYEQFRSEEVKSRLQPGL